MRRPALLPLLLGALGTLGACTTVGDLPRSPRPPYPESIVAAVPAAERSGRPPLQAGQRWTYRRVDLWRHQEIERFRQELLAERGGGWSVRWTILDSENALRRDSVTLEALDLDSHGFADPSLEGSYEPLRFPLAVGDSWSFAYRIPSRQVQVTQTATVQGWETVTVPAGTFRALRVEHRGSYRATADGYSWSGRIRETWWYAPQARRVVMHEYSDTRGDGSTWDQWRDELVEMRL